MKSLAIFATILLCFPSIQMIEGFDRLPNNVIPSHYNLYMNIFLEQQIFNGNVEIKVNISKPTNNITLHATQLKIKDVSIIPDGGSAIKYDRINSKDEFQFLIIEFKQQLHEGNYTIKVLFEGNFSTEMKGLYATNYSYNEFEHPMLAAVTNFYPSYARSVFPCFDEPALKASFKISIRRERRYVAISNMPVESSEDTKDGRFRDVFKVTPKLPTYQIAFAICDFPKTPYGRGDIYTRPSHNSFRQTYLADISEDIFHQIEDYLQTALPSKKIDIMTVRHLQNNNDGLGSMGLILLAEENLFQNNKVNRTKGEQDALLILSNVYLQQFFGNLVTEAWWYYRWLNEGITTFLQYTILHKLRPDWRLTEQRALILLRDVIENDYSMTCGTKQLEPDEHVDYFNRLRYKKGAVILLTLQSMIGSITFQLGLQRLIHQHWESEITSNDLWHAMDYSIYFDDTQGLHTLVQKKDLISIMKRWELFDGVPVVNVTRNYTAPFTIEFSQQRLDQYLEGYLQEKWLIPINYATQSKPHFAMLRPIGILDPSKPFVFNVQVHPNEWLIINIQAAYFYLVNYDETNWKRLSNALNSKNFEKIPPLTRGKLLYDAFTLARFGKLKYSVALSLIKYLEREKDYIALDSFFYVFDFFYTNFAGLKDFHYLQTFVAKALQPALEHVGFHENTTLKTQHTDNLNRLQLIKWTCLLGNQLCRKTTTHMLKREFYTLPSDLKEVVVCTGLMDAKFELWNRLLYINNHQSDVAISNGLGCSQDKHSLNTYLDNTLKYNVSVFEEIYPRGIFGINFVLKYLVENWRKVYESLTQEDKLSLLHGISKYITTEAQLNMLKNISTNFSMPELNATFNTTIYKATQKVEWVKLYSNDITQWIRKEFNKANFIGKLSVFMFFIILIVDFCVLF